MKSKASGSGGRRNRWPLDLDHHDPEGVASFLLGLGYDQEDVSNALQSRCSVDRLTANGIVTDVATQQQGGQK